MAFILANAVYLGIDSDHNEASNPNNAEWYFIMQTDAQGMMIGKFLGKLIGKILENVL